MNNANNRVAELLNDLPSPAPTSAPAAPFSPEWMRMLCNHMTYLFERWQATPPPREDSQKRLEEQRLAKQHRRALEGLAQMIAAFDADRHPRCDPETAVCVAEQVAGYLENLRDMWVSPPPREYLTWEQMNNYERDEFTQMNAQWAALGPMAKRLLNRKRVAAVADGRVRMTPFERRRWREALERVVEGLNGHRKMYDELLDRELARDPAPAVPFPSSQPADTGMEDADRSVSWASARLLVSPRSSLGTESI